MLFLVLAIERIVSTKNMHRLPTFCITYFCSMNETSAMFNRTRYSNFMWFVLVNKTWGYSDDVLPRIEGRFRLFKQCFLLLLLFFRENVPSLVEWLIDLLNEVSRVTHTCKNVLGSKNWIFVKGDEHLRICDSCSDSHFLARLRSSLFVTLILSQKH